MTVVASTSVDLARVHTLAVMPFVAVIVAPLVLLYQGWTYRVFRGRLGAE